eukprot:COSAG01_NODE_31446_length_597_cov_2.186747_1_plen_38_part_10
MVLQLYTLCITTHKHDNTYHVLPLRSLAAVMAATHART